MTLVPRRKSERFELRSSPENLAPSQEVLSVCCLIACYLDVEVHLAYLGKHLDLFLDLGRVLLLAQQRANHYVTRPVTYLCTPADDSMSQPICQRGM